MASEIGRMLVGDSEKATTGRSGSNGHYPPSPTTDAPRTRTGRSGRVYQVVTPEQMMNQLR